VDVEVTHNYLLAVKSDSTTYNMATATAYGTLEAIYRKHERCVDCERHFRLTGDRIEYANPASSGKKGAIRKAAGTPGTWTTFGSET
jgi:hypothetical protein